MGLRYCLGCETPSVFVFAILAKLPSLHSHAVKRDEHTAAIVLWELFFIVVGHRIRRPVRRKCCDRSDLVGANADRFPAVPPVLWGEDKLLHELVVVALGPAIVAPLL